MNRNFLYICNMQYKKRFFPLMLMAVVFLASCEEKDDPVQSFDTGTYVPPQPNNGNNTNTNPSDSNEYKYGLKDLARANDLLIGAAFTYSEYAYDDSLKVVLKRDFDAVTFGNEMKHDCVVDKNGNLNFWTADQMVGWTKDCGVQLFGHTLGWHSQQQRDYLDPLIQNASDAATAASLVQAAHKSWVDKMVSHFDVYGWDVVNEVFTDGGGWRSKYNTQDSYHVFLWGEYYDGGTKEFVDQAFHNTKEVLEREGKSAILYINDYNLEGPWAIGKLEALCTYAEQNPDVTGVGSQMHISADVDRNGVTNMLKRMVKTGKKVRISELDVAKGNTDQGETIVFVFQQYLDLVPVEQRGGITFWGVSDKNSWIGENQAPLLYDSKYKRKDSYDKLYNYLLERSGLEEE